MTVRLNRQQERYTDKAVFCVYLRDSFIGVKRSTCVFHCSTAPLSSVRASLHASNVLEGHYLAIIVECCTDSE